MHVPLVRQKLTLSCTLPLFLSLAATTVAQLQVPNPIFPGNQDTYICDQDTKKSYTFEHVTFELSCKTGLHTSNLYNVQDKSLKECAEICARDSQCVATDWRSNVCHVKSVYSTNPGGTTYETWQVVEKRSPRSCPAARLTEEKSDAQVVENPHCPTDHGNIFTVEDGSHYTLLCCSHNPTAEMPDTRSVVNSFKECARKCSSTTGCKSYVYTSTRGNAAADVPGTCKLYETGKFETTKCGDDSHDYAYLTPAPAIESPDELTMKCSTECPFAHQQVYDSKGGEAFRMHCGKRHGTKVIHQDTQDSFQDCMDSCSMLNACHSVDYHVNSKMCFYGKHHGSPSIDAIGFQSAHSLGCSGACDAKKC
ncbi:hypothetical protein BJX61DRAFT_543749 [Aspergillus egyptiacus]|nr:hypothetical protein BJX61DRAFT_543749 [Aspergillus egyptiacus]